MKVIIYLPALNEEKYIRSVLGSMPKILEKVSSVEYLVVNDGSTDRTEVFAAEAGAHVISHNRNLGVGAAFHTAVHYALENSVDILVSIDADGQFEPDDIPQMIAPILENRADMVIGNRFRSGRPQNMPLLKYWGNQQIAKVLGFVGDQKFQDVSCGFRAYNREALLHLNLFGNFTYTHESILSLLYQRMRIVEVPIVVKYHNDRKSRVAKSLSAYAFQTSKIIFRILLDYKPMRVFGLFAGLMFVIGIIFEVLLFGHYFLYGAFTPYKSFGFIGLGFLIFGTLVFLVALIADMINRLRRNQDKLLYELKRSVYEK
jgi:glycosyltransferase involved in cell wall biosynthesis